MRRRTAAAILAVMSGLAAASQTQAAQALASSLNLSPGVGYIVINDLNGARSLTENFNFATDNWAAKPALSPLSAAASVANDAGPNRADASVSATATYAANGKSGALLVDNAAITEVAPGSEVGGGFSAFTGFASYNSNQFDPTWTYTFKASGDGTFDIALNAITSQINIPAQDLADWEVGFVQGDSAAGVAGAAQRLTSTASFGIVAGQTYTVGLIDAEQVVPVSGDVDLSFDEKAGFSWSIDEAAAAGGAPEPASWALMTAGFGLVGGGLRSARRRARGAIQARSGISAMARRS